jgi:hypothetical protein
MNDSIPENDLITPNDNFQNVPLKMGFIFIIMLPLAIYFL